MDNQQIIINAIDKLFNKNLNINLNYYYMDNQQVIIDAIDKLFNKNLNICNNYIFIYTPPKVGSTTLVTSLRVSLGKSFNIIHIHDETMLSVLTGINNVKINDIINFLANNGKTVYVIDVYRTPVERKISEFFEKLSPYHFNNTEENISHYSIRRIFDRFNKLFPHLENGDHYIDKYDISEPVPFDFEKKYTIQLINNITYVKLRLCDSQLWGSILSNILQTDIVMIDDYKTETKSIGELYKRFKNEYKLPINYYENIKTCKYFNFYYNEEERNNYLNTWNKNLEEECIPYTRVEFDFYMNLCLENQYINDIQIHHYIDNGCFCELCKNKRRDIFFRAKNGEKIFEKIIHSNVVFEEKKNIIKRGIEIINKKIEILNKKRANKKIKKNQFAINHKMA